MCKIPLLFVLLASFCLSTTACFADRPAWTTSRVQGTPSPPLPYRVERVFGKHQFDQPVVFTSAPDRDSMFLLEIPGKIYELPSENISSPTLIGELAKHTRNFQMSYGLAFHPEFETNREIYVCYKRGGDPEHGSVVSRLRLTNTTPMQIERGSEQILYTWLAGGHNGGCVKFGPDGYLYVSAGDAAAPFPPDPLKAGQDLSNLLSTIVRIDVDGQSGERNYRIPADNPFVNLSGARPEIFAYGFRNPWRMAFDRKTGDLWVGDVGWELWEMIYSVKSGGNYGWSIVEGPHDVHPNGKRGPTPVLKPAASHSHTEARSITGGQVYHGDRLPELRGAYVYGDHVTGRIWTLRKSGDNFEGPKEIARSPLQIICFGLNNEGELFVVDYLGSIHRLVRNEQKQTNHEFPKSLSQSGIFTSVRDHTLADGVLPYSIIAEPWMDGATAERFIGVPGSQRIGVYEEGSGHAGWDGKHRGSWKFPKNTVLGKTISRTGHRIETQLLHFDGQAWQAYTYVWDSKQTDANLADDVSRTIEVKINNEKHDWLISNRGDCMICHSNAADMILGFKPNQLRRPTARGDDQLDYLSSLGLFEKAPPNHQTLTDPLDDNEDLESRARSYLHVNCSHCHRPEGGGAVAMNVLFSQSPGKTRMIDQLPLQGSFGIENARVVAPGDPFRSVLLYRFCKLGPGHMPKFGGIEVDQRGADLLHDWIEEMVPNEPQDEYATNLNALRVAASNSDTQLIEWLSNVRHSMMATHALRAGTIEPALHEKVLTVSRQLPATTQDLFESFIPPDQRTKRLGNSIDAREILAVRGAADRGRKLFLSASLSCKNCHAIQPRVYCVGPNLSGLKKAQYKRATLLQNILQPSEVISEEYHTHSVQTINGELFTGVVRPNGNSIVLRDAQNKAHRIAVADIEFRKISDVSIMPEKLLEALTLQQARDLVEFLCSLGEGH